MRKIDNWQDVKEGGFEQLPIGPQICKIKSVKDVPDKEYLIIEFDIADGAFKGTFADQAEQFGSWPSAGTTYRSYKKTALGFFKSFIVAVEKSNPQFVWAWKEEDLVGKYVVANYGEEEYEDEATLEVKVSVKAREFRSLPALRAGEVKTLSIQKLKKESAPAPKDNHSNNSAGTPSGTANKNPNVNPDDDLPF